MERVRGRILKGDKVVLEDLDITLYFVTPAKRLPSWSGSCHLSDPGAYIAPGRPYRLVLEDGRSGEIFVSGLGPSTRGTGVRFTGSGSLT
jgi:hypothetical protein